MPIPVSEAKAWPVVFAEQFLSTPPPYFGTNIFDVLTVNWEAVLKNLRFQHEGVKGSGGRSHLFAVRDDGQRKRVIWINYFPNGIQADKETLESMGGEEIMSNWMEFCNLIESYEWFCTTEQPSAEP